MDSEIKFWEFALWLDKYRPTEVCGKLRSADRCPVARYLQTKNPNMSTDVGAENYQIHEENTPHCYFGPLPDWTKEFVTIIDSEKEEWVTAQEAKEVLHRVENKFCLENYRKEENNG